MKGGTAKLHGRVWRQGEEEFLWIFEVYHILCTGLMKESVQKYVNEVTSIPIMSFNQLNFKINKFDELTFSEWRMSTKSFSNFLGVCVCLSDLWFGLKHAMKWNNIKLKFRDQFKINLDFEVQGERRGNFPYEVNFSKSFFFFFNLQVSS